MRIAHEDLLLGLESDCIVTSRVVAADAGTGRSTESVICKALAVKFEALRFATIAWLVLLMRKLLFLLVWRMALHVNVKLRLRRLRG